MHKICYKMLYVKKILTLHKLFLCKLSLWFTQKVLLHADNHSDKTHAVTISKVHISTSLRVLKVNNVYH